MSNDPNEYMRSPRSMNNTGISGISRYAPAGNRDFDTYLRRLAHSYGLALGQVDASYLKKGYRQATEEEFQRLHDIASYNYQTGNSYDYGGLDYNPWENAADKNDAYASYYSKHKKKPTTNDLDKYYTVNYKYKGQYGNTAEDQAAQEAGQKPHKYQVTDKAAGELPQYLAEVKNLYASSGGRVTSDQLRELMKKYPTISSLDSYAKDQAQKALETGGSDFSGILGTKKASDVLDSEGLKKLGYDSKTGFDSLIIDIINSYGEAQAAKIRNNWQMAVTQPQVQQTAENRRGTTNVKANALADVQSRIVAARPVTMPKVARRGEMSPISVQPGQSPIEAMAFGTMLGNRQPPAGAAGSAQDERIVKGNEAIANGKYADYSMFDESDLNDPRVVDFVLQAAQYNRNRAYPTWAVDIANWALGPERAKDVDYDKSPEERKELARKQLQETKDYYKRTTGNPYYTQPQESELTKQAKALGAGAAEAVTFGTWNAPALEEVKQGAPKVAMLGEVLGMIPPTVQLEKAAGAALETYAPKLTNTLAKSAIRGSASLGTYGLMSDVAQGKPADEVAIDFVYNAATGALGDAGFKMLNDVVGGWIPKVGSSAYNKMLKSGELARRLAPRTLHVSLRNWRRRRQGRAPRRTILKVFSPDLKKAWAICPKRRILDRKQLILRQREEKREALEKIYLSRTWQVKRARGTLIIVLTLIQITGRHLEKG
jgi:hypothetical protein